MNEVMQGHVVLDRETTLIARFTFDVPVSATIGVVQQSSMTFAFPSTLIDTMSARTVANEAAQVETPATLVEAVRGGVAPVGQRPERRCRRVEPYGQ